MQLLYFNGRRTLGICTEYIFWSVRNHRKSCFSEGDYLLRCAKSYPGQLNIRVPPAMVPCPFLRKMFTSGGCIPWMSSCEQKPYFTVVSVDTVVSLFRMPANTSIFNTAEHDMVSDYDRGEHLVSHPSWK